MDFARTNGVYLLDRKALDRLLATPEEELEEALEGLLREQEAALARGERTRARYYAKEDFGPRWQRLLNDVAKDLELLKGIKEQVHALGLDDPAKDPKAAALVDFLRKNLEEKPGRKIVVFSEFTDTVEHLERALAAFGIPVLAVGKDYSPALLKRVVRNFDASLDAAQQRDDFKVLLASDRLSEGISLHRAGVVVNYDIPWNPTRLIQRLGRVNRVGSPFGEIRLHHFFPTEQGAGVADPLEVAKYKLFLIHKALGEDAQILSPEEEPTPARIYEQFTRLPEEEAGLETWARQEWERLVVRYPELPERIRNLPSRLKVAILGEAQKALVVVRKGMSFFALCQVPGAKEPEYLFLPEVFQLLKGAEGEERRRPSPWFLETYRKLAKRLEEEVPFRPNRNSLEARALFNVRTALQNPTFSEEERVWLEHLDRDLTHEGLLPRYALRRLQEVDLGRQGALEAFRATLQEVWRRFGRLLARQEEAGPPKVDLVVGVEVVTGE